jgi:uncharacterized protein (TIGR00730 family)
MGIIADAVLQHGGEVIRVIPETMVARELAHTGVTSMHVVASMHARKARMAELADGFIAMPGGYGTFEELFEIITWAQLGMHRKPIGLLNVAGYFAPLMVCIEHAIAEGFIRPEHRQLTVMADTPTMLLDLLAHHSLPPTSLADVTANIRPDEQLAPWFPTGSMGASRFLAANGHHTHMVWALARSRSLPHLAFEPLHSRLVGVIRNGHQLRTRVAATHSLQERP